MPENTPDIRDDLGELRRLRDELRRIIHLSGPEARARFAALQDRFLDLENRVAFLATGPDTGTAAAISASTEKLADELRHEMRAFRACL